MKWSLVVPLLVGACAVLQGGLNRQVAASHGLLWAVGINALVFLVAWLFWLGVAHLQPHWLPAGFGTTAIPQQFTWWYLLPGVFGFALVVGIPWAIGRLGAVQVFIAIVVAQVITSGIWDAVVEQAMPSPMRLLGMGLAVAGVALATLG